VSILNGDTKAEVEINNLEIIIKKEKAEMKRIFDQIMEDLDRIKFIKNNDNIKTKGDDLNVIYIEG
jgi:hypothetical protein